MTKQNMPRLTESQLFTIEALNKIQGFVWPENANFASMDDGDRGVDFWSSRPELDIDECTYTQGGLQQANSIHSKHPDWRGSLISKAQFDSVDGWVRNSGAQPVSDECIVECKVDGPLGAIGYLPATVWNWERGGLTHWRYHKPSNAEINEASAITEPAPYLARRSFSWVGCENGFVIPDRIKGVEIAIPGGPIIEVLAELDTDLQKQGWPKFQSAHIDLKRIICNNTNQNITAHVIRYLPIDAREAN